jgi:NarL family two-component system response regulator LiaR
VIDEGAIRPHAEGHGSPAGGRPLVHEGGLAINPPPSIAAAPALRTRPPEQHPAAERTDSLGARHDNQELFRSTIRVVIADGDPLARRAIRDVLQGQDDFVVAADAVDGREAIELAAHYRPDVVLAELELPVVNGVEVAAAIRQSAPDAKVVLLSTNGDVEMQIRALRAGACGYLEKSIDPVVLPRVLRGVIAGEAAIMRETTMHLVERLRSASGDDSVRLRPIKSPLTTREWEVLDLLCEDASTEEIAERLVLTLDTVYSHVKHILRKLGVHSRAEAVALAEELRAGRFGSAG